MSEPDNPTRKRKTPINHSYLAALLLALLVITGVFALVGLLLYYFTISQDDLKTLALIVGATCGPLFFMVLGSVTTLLVLRTMQRKNEHT